MSDSVPADGLEDWELITSDTTEAAPSDSPMIWELDAGTDETDFGPPQETRTQKALSRPKKGMIRFTFIESPFIK